jgi:3-oxoadipate enol-lactonase
MAEYPIRSADLGDHETSVFDSGGSGAPLILIHALSLDHRVWADLIPLLLDKHRVIAYDLRGFGGAAAAPAVQSIWDFADDLSALMDHLRLPKATIVGLSLGGVVAQCFTLNVPDRVEKLGILASTAWSHPAFRARAEAGEREGMRAQVQPTLNRWFSAETLSQDPWGIRYARERIESVSAIHWAAAWRALDRIDFSSRLHEIKVPAFLVAGESDPSTPLEVMQKLCAAIKGCSLDIIPAASHILPLEKARETANVILRRA